MYLVYSEKLEDFKKIKATLGSATQLVNSRNSLIENLESYPIIRVVIVGPSVKSIHAFELASELRIQYPLVNVILVRNRIDVAILSSALAAGIKDVVDMQDATSLMNAVKRCEDVAEQISQRNSNEANVAKRGRVITVYSAKGGSGKTTISSNLAAALASSEGTSVCLVDLDLQFGDVATALRIPPKKTISQAIDSSESLDLDDILNLLVRYEDYFDVLLAPISPADIENISTALISKIINTLQRQYDFVVVDTSPTLTEVIAKLLQESDLALLLTNLDMLSIKNLKLTISALNAIGLAKSKRKFVINRGDVKVGIEPEDVAELLDEKIDYVIPSSTKVTSATNEGRLVIHSYPHNPVSRAIMELADEIKAEVSAEPELVA